MSLMQKIRVALRGDQSQMVAQDSNMTPNTIARRSQGGRIAPPRAPGLQSIGNITYRTPPSRAFAANPSLGRSGPGDTPNAGGGGPGNAGAENAGDRVQRSELDVQPSWHYESQYEYFNHARPANTPHTAGIRANDFRTLGDQFGGRQ